MRRIGRLLRVLAVLLVAATQGGCILTHHMWNDANNEFASEPQLVVAKASEATTAPVTRVQVIYQVDSGLDAPTYLLYDVPAALAAEHAFSAAAWLRQTPTTLASPQPTEVDFARYARIERQALPPESFVRVISLAEKSALVTASTAEQVAHDPRGTVVPVQVCVFMTGGVIAAPPNAMTVKLKGGEDFPITETSKLMAFPYHQPRPKKERDGARIRAALFTPFTLLADVVVSPVIVVLVLTHGR